MKAHLSKLALVFLLLSEAEAGEYFISSGINASRFYDVASKRLLGYSLSFGREWQITKSSALTLGISYFCRGALLENKTVHPYPGDIVSVYNISCRIRYLDVPLCYRRYVGANSRKRFYACGGFAIALALDDGSSKERLRFWWDPNFPREEADYFYNDDPGFFYISESSTIDLVLGSGVRWRRLAFEGQVRINWLGDADTITGISSIDTEFITFGIVGSWYF